MTRFRRSSALGVALSLTLLAVGAQPALAGCVIEVTYVNDFNEDIQTNPYWSEGKIQGGVYKRLKSSSVWITIPAYGQKVRSYTLDFGCNHDRRYKFHMTWRGNPSYKYKPSANGWTRNTSITVTFNWPFP